MRRNEALLAGAKALGIVEVGGHPVDSLEADLFLQEHPEVRSRLKEVTLGYLYGASVSWCHKKLG